MQHFDMTTSGGDFDIMETAKEFAPVLGNFAAGAVVGAGACYVLDKALGQKNDKGEDPVIGTFGTGKRLAVNTAVGVGLAIGAAALSKDEEPEVLVSRALGVFGGAVARSAVTFAEAKIAEMTDDTTGDSSGGTSGSDTTDDSTSTSTGSDPTQGVV